MTSLNLNYLPAGSVSKYSHIGVGASTYDFEGRHNSVYSSVFFFHLNLIFKNQFLKIKAGLYSVFT